MQHVGYTHLNICDLHKLDESIVFKMLVEYMARKIEVLSDVDTESVNDVCAVVVHSGVNTPP